jgi:hypothetical protein
MMEEEDWEDHKVESLSQIKSPFSLSFIGFTPIKPHWVD